MNEQEEEKGNANTKSYFHPILLKETLADLHL